VRPVLTKIIKVVGVGVGVVGCSNAVPISGAMKTAECNSSVSSNLTSSAITITN